MQGRKVYRKDYRIWSLVLMKNWILLHGFVDFSQSPRESKFYQHSTVNTLLILKRTQENRVRILETTNILYNYGIYSNLLDQLT